MTTRTKKAAIPAETELLLILNRHSGAVEGWCEDCEELIGLIRPEEAVALTAFRLQAVYRALEPGQLHYLESLDSLLHTRVSSLLKPA
jgi:hypothetical protein